MYTTSTRQPSSSTGSFSSALAQTCRAPEQCAQKAQALKSRMQRDLPPSLLEYEELLADHAFRVTEHADQRMNERNISLRAVYEVLEAYQPIEWSVVKNPQMDAAGQKLFQFVPYRILIVGESELDARHLSIVCAYGEKPAKGHWALHILTVYDPSSEPHRWAPGYTHRTCFCKDDSKQSQFVGSLVSAHYQSNATVYSSY